MAIRQTLKNARGERVPAVTTILNRYKESGALIAWANKQGLAGRTLTQARDLATTPGQLCHIMINARLRGIPAKLPTAAQCGLSEQDYAASLALAEKGFAGFLRWYGGVTFKMLASECTLVSEQYQFGGRLDCVARINTTLTVTEWKATKGVYPDAVLQLVAYRQLWNETHPDEAADDVLLLQIDKETAAFTPHTWPPTLLETAWRQFVLLRQAFPLDKELADALKKAAA